KHSHTVALHTTLARFNLDISINDSIHWKSEPILFFIMILRHPRSTLFPYTTLFRSTTTNFAAATFGTAGNIATGIGGEDLNLTGDRKSTRLNSSHVENSHADTSVKKQTNGTTGVTTDYTFVSGTQTASVTAATLTVA